MSHHATTRAWESGARGNDLLVLLALADFAGGHDDAFDYAYPAVPTIGEKTGLSPRTVQRCLRSLAESGHISETGEHFWKRGKVTTQYRLMEPRGGDSVTGRQSDAPSETTPMGRHSDAQPRPITPSSEGTSSARASRSNRVPDDFPDDLRPHARHVMAVLRGIAQERGAREVTAAGVARIVASRPRKPLVKAAHDCAAWIADHPEASCVDVLARYRRWLDREPDLAAAERLADDGTPTTVPRMPPSNVHRMPRRDGTSPEREERLRIAGERMLRDMGIGDANAR